MDILNYLLYLSALVVGFVMGLLGGGGSILTIPIFVYMFGISPVVATAYSLFVVGSTATVGSLKNFQQKTIDFRIGFLFGIPSLIGTYITRRYILPAMPDQLCEIFGFALSKDLFVMILLAIMMVSASVSMIRAKSKEELDTSPASNLFTIILGFIIGILTAFVGAGGGFIIVPVLVFLTCLPIKRAIGTSLFIIMMKSFVGFLGDLQTTVMDWNFLIIFSILAAVGILIGVRVAKATKPDKLKKIFGWFILIVGVYIIYKEIKGY